MSRLTTCAAAFALALSTQVLAHDSHERRTVELQYKIFEIPFLPADEAAQNQIVARSINDRGEVLVVTFDNQGDPGSNWFIWHRGHRSPPLVSPDPTMHFLDLRKINNRSEVVGSIVDDFEGIPPKSRAVVWRGGQPTVLGPLPNDSDGSTWGRSINDWGEIVGYATNLTSPVRGFRWFRGHFEVLPNTTMVDINNRGQALGTGGETGALLWSRKGEVRAVDNLPGATGMLPFAINDRGQVVGAAFFTTAAGTTQHPFLWQDGAVEQLPELEGAGITYPRAINAAGTAVGSSGQSAVVWRDGEIHDLNTLVVTNDPKLKRAHLDVAWDINNFGWIAAEGVDPTQSGQPEHAYVLVPEWVHRRDR